MSKTVKKLTVSVTYKVGLGDLKIPDNIYEQLLEAHDNGNEIDPLTLLDADLGDWLLDNIRERDCMEWDCEIDDISNTT
jgi:hypothetical protein